MRPEFRTLIFAHTLACKTDTHSCARVIRNKDKWKELTSDGLLREAKLLVNPAESVIEEEHAGAVVALAEIGCSAELAGDSMAESSFPLLGPQRVEIGRSKLDGEVTAAVATAMTAVALLLNWKHEDGKCHRHRVEGTRLSLRAHQSAPRMPSGMVTIASLALSRSASCDVSASRPSPVSEAVTT